MTGNGEGLGSGLIKEAILVMEWRDGGRPRKIMIISSPTDIQRAKLQNRKEKKKKKAVCLFRITEIRSVDLL